MQVGFMHEKGIIDVFILRRLQDEYCANGKSCIYFVDLEKSFDGLPQKVLQWVMRKKGISEVLVRLTINLYEGAKTRIGVDFELSEVEVGMHQGFVLSPFPFAIVVDVIFKLVRGGVLSELLYIDDLILLIEMIQE